MSHPHADHHLGIAEVLSARATALKQKQHEKHEGEDEDYNRPPLVLMAPKSVGLWLEHWSRLDRSLDPSSYVLVSCADLLPHLAPDMRTDGDDGSTGANATPSSDLTASVKDPAAAVAAASGAQTQSRPDEDLRWLGAAPGDEVRKCRDCNEHYLFTTGEQVLSQVNESCCMSLCWLTNR